MRGLAVDSRIRVRENLIVNPSFEAGFGGWTSANGGARALSADSHSGTQSLLVTCPTFAGQAGAGILLGPLAPGAYTFSAWVKTATLGWLQVTDGSGVVTGHYVSSGAWERASLNCSFSTAGTHTFYALLQNPIDGDTLLVDAVLLTEGPDLIDYFDGGSPSARWTGTAGASTSLCLVGPDGRPVGT